MANHTITTTWKKNLLLESDNPHGNYVMMEPDSNFGGTDQGLNPKALMLSSLAGCTALDVLSLLKKMRVQLDDFNIVVNGELAEEHPKYYNKVSIDYYFTGTELDKAKIEKAVNLSEERYCGVMKMFKAFTNISINIHLKE